MTESRGNSARSAGRSAFWPAWTGARALAALFGTWAALAPGCTRRAAEPLPPASAPEAAEQAVPSSSGAAAPGAIPGSEERVEERAAMVEEQIRRRGVSDEAVLRAMGEVPRHRFVPASLQRAAYDDGPLPIGLGQTISQPYIVALMTEAARIPPGGKVLEVGTGSGYGAAVASRLAREVISIEIIPELAEAAAARLRALGFDNVRVLTGDGYRGVPAEAPFDAIIVTAAPDHVPEPLKEQLAPGGRLVIPVGPEGGVQELLVLTKTEHGLREEKLIPVRFVPMTGEAQRR